MVIGSICIGGGSGAASTASSRARFVLGAAKPYLG